MKTGQASLIAFSSRCTYVHGALNRRSATMAEDDWSLPSNLPGHSEEKCSSSRHADENVVIAAIIDAMIAGAANIRLF